MVVTWVVNSHRINPFQPSIDKCLLTLTGFFESYTASEKPLFGDPFKPMDTTELESVTSSMSTKRSNQLSYASGTFNCTQEPIDCKQPQAIL
jgi:hypothetical protein